MANNDHKYQAPGPNDKRSPCPALNALANHGYLPRDGRDITPKQIVEATYEAFNLAKFVSSLITYLSFIFTGKFLEGKMTLEDLFTEPSSEQAIIRIDLDHPMSLARPDRSLGGEDYKHVSPKLIESLISEKNDKGKLTKESFAKQYIKRRDESRRDNPKFHGLSFPTRLIPFFNYSMTLNVLCGSEDKRGEEIDVKTLESFYKDERFPDNWKKAEQTVTNQQLRNDSDAIQKLYVI